MEKSSAIRTQRSPSQCSVSSAECLPFGHSANPAACHSYADESNPLRTCIYTYARSQLGEPHASHQKTNPPHDRLPRKHAIMRQNQPADVRRPIRQLACIWPLEINGRMIRLLHLSSTRIKIRPRMEAQSGLCKQFGRDQPHSLTCLVTSCLVPLCPAVVVWSCCRRLVLLPQSFYPQYHSFPLSLSTMSSTRWFVELLECERATFDDDAYPLPKHQKDAFEVCCELLKEEETSMAKRSKQRRSTRHRAHTLLCDVFSGVGPEVFLLCTLCTTISKLATVSLKSLIPELRRWWKTVSHPAGLTETARELCEANSISFFGGSGSETSAFGGYC